MPLLLLLQILVGIHSGYLLKKLFFGKSVCLLGSRATGKSVIAKFLATGTIEKNCNSTIKLEIYKGKVLHLKDLKLHIEEPDYDCKIETDTISDLPGGNSHYSSWKEEFSKSNLIIYLYRSYLVVPNYGLTDIINSFDLKTEVGYSEFNKFIKSFNYIVEKTVGDKTMELPNEFLQDYSKWEKYYEKYRIESVKEIKNHIQLINDWQDKNKFPKKNVIFVGTFGDYIPKYSKPSPENEGRMYDEYIQHLGKSVPEIKKLGTPNSMICSLLSPEEIPYYITQMLNAVKKKKRKK